MGSLIALTFTLRLLSGVGLSLALPVLGYPQPCQMQGYLFKDACERDQEAFSMAQAGGLLLLSSQAELDSDQYGGLAFLSAWIYRTLSPDAHRPFLILIAGSFVAAMGLPFFVLALQARWNARVAFLAGWIYALYPDGIFFASSQMREPFLVGLSSVSIWAVLTWDRQAGGRRLAVLGLSVLAMIFFSTRVALVLAGILLLCLWQSALMDRWGWRGKWLGWSGLFLGAVLLGMLVSGWFRTAAHWDMVVTIKQSGWVQKIIGEVGEEWTLPVITVYGLAQPVLPAAIADSALPLWKGIAIYRAAGWYLLAPFLMYGMMVVWRDPHPRRRRLMIWLALAVAGWLVISAIRGGGDQTDNPRYRSIFLPWLAILVACGVDWAILHRDSWLKRFLLVEAIFLAFFTNWYVSRYFHLWVRLPFWQMVGWIISLISLVFWVGWVRQWVSHKETKKGGRSIKSLRR